MSLKVNPYRMLESLRDMYRRKWKDENFPVTERELELGRALKGIIDDYIAGKTSIVQEEENEFQPNFEGATITSEDFRDLDMEFSEHQSTEQPSSEVQSSEVQSSEVQSSEVQSSSSSYKPSQEEVVKEIEYPSWEKVIEAVTFWRSTKSHPIKKQKCYLETATVKNSFGFVKDKRQLYRWEQMINSGNAPREYKLAQLVKAVRTEFMEARSKQQAVHDRDITRWSIFHARELNVPNFTCSKFWLWKFKKTSRISSRKVTTFISRRTFERAQDVVSQAEEFVSKMRKLIAAYGPENVYNMDQSGFERVMMSRNTLAETGSSSVKVVTQSTHGLTHTYTIQPTISAAGKLVTPVAICMQEPNGEFGPIVNSTMYRCPDLLYPIASKSGKMGKNQLEDWFLNVMLPNGGNRFILIVDSYSAHKSLQDLIPDSQDIQIIPIPPGATGLIQPLDVHGFRYWKDLARYFNKEAIVFDDNLQMHSRNHIFQMHSLIVRLMASTKLEDFWKFSWYKCGYLPDEIVEHPSPMQVCIGETASCSKCNKMKCVHCPWCDRSYCFQHIFVELHTNCTARS